MYEKIGGALQDAYAEAPTLRPREPTNLGDRSALTSASTLALTSTLTPGWCSCWSCCVGVGVGVGCRQWCWLLAVVLMLLTRRMLCRSWTHRRCLCRPSCCRQLGVDGVDGALTRCADTVRGGLLGCSSRAGASASVRGRRRAPPVSRRWTVFSGLLGLFVGF